MTRDTEAGGAGVDTSREAVERLSIARERGCKGRTTAQCAEALGDCDCLIAAATLRALLSERDAATQRAERAEAERDEADRRAGAAERRNEQLREDAFRRNQWLRKAKEDAGYDDNVSFDVVWRDALSAIRALKDTTP